MTRGWRVAVVVAITATMVFSPSAAAKPVFDCTKAEVRRAHPAQCPELGVPFLLGGGQTGGGAPECQGLCGVLRDVLGHIPGLGGIL
jgi:hypothetical protein